jgi:hypothetical protein
MSSEIMGFQMDPNHLSRFIHNFSPGCIGYWKYPLIRPNPFPGYVFLQTTCNLLRDEDNFPFLATLGGSKSELSVLDVIGCQFQYLADPHSTAGHQLKHEPISGFDGAEDDFIHHFLFKNGPMDRSRWAIQLLQHGGIAWASEIGIEVLGDEVEKGSEL